MLPRRIGGLGLAVFLGCSGPACRPATVSVRGDGPQLSHGTTIGEVSSSGAVVWGRCDRTAILHVRLRGVDGERATEVTAAADFTGRVGFDALAPDTPYAYDVWCGEATGYGESGGFHTAPAPDTLAPVRFAWSGDVGGQNVCRDRERGYPIFSTLVDRRLDFFIGLGDMIYADDPCLPRGRYGNLQITGPPGAVDLAGFRAHWRYNWSDPDFQQLRRGTPYYAVWDDHEIRDDSGPHDDETPLAPGVHLLPIALQAFLEYQPIIPPSDAPTRLYRSVRWGKHIELFLLDTRQYRDPLAQPDSDTHPKTMLGAEQMAWIERALARSDATWKVIVASVPLSIPTGKTARDGFADGGTGQGYEHEAAGLFGALRTAGIRNSLWITTDVHFATGFVYRPFVDDPNWTTMEFTSGPLNAGVFPRPDLDATFHPERLFQYGPTSADAIGSFDEAIGWFNFGEIDVAADGTLTVSIINGRGTTVFQRALHPRA